MTFRLTDGSQTGTTTRVGKVSRSQLAWLNLVIAVWFGIAYLLYTLAWRVAHASAVAANWGPFAARAFMGPFVLLTLLVVLWTTFYKRCTPGARTFALLTSVFLVIVCFIELMTASSSKTAVDWRHFLAAAYVGLSHFLYAAFGKERFRMSAW